MARAQEDQFAYITQPVTGVHQSPQRALRIISRMNGIDPDVIVDQYGDKGDQNIANFDYDPKNHQGRYVGRLPDAEVSPDVPDDFPAAAAPGVLPERVTFNAPKQKEAVNHRTLAGGDPFAGMGGQ